MKREINLSLGRIKNNTLAKRILLGSSILFSIAILISIGILSYRLYLSNNLSGLTNDEENFTSQINSMREQRDKLTIIEGRLEEAQRIISRRLNITAKFDEVADIIPPQASLETFTGIEEEVEVKVESESLGALGQLINDKITTLANDKKRGIKKIEMKNFLLNPTTKVYSVTFGVTYK